MGGAMNYVQCDNVAFLHNLVRFVLQVAGGQNRQKLYRSDV